MLDYIHQEGTLFHKTQRKTVLLGCSLWTSSEANGSTSASLATHSRHTATVLQQEGTALHPTPGAAGCNCVTVTRHSNPSRARGCRVQSCYSKNAHYSIPCQRLQGATMLQQEGTPFHPVSGAAGGSNALVLASCLILHSRGKATVALRLTFGSVWVPKVVTFPRKLLIGVDSLHLGY